MAIYKLWRPLRCDSERNILTMANHSLMNSPDETEQSHGRSKHRQSVNQISIPSFSAFRQRVSSIPLSPGVRRKPVPDKPSPRAVSFSYSPSFAQPHDASVRTRPCSIDSPLPQQETGLLDVWTSALASEQRNHQASALQK